MNRLDRRNFLHLVGATLVGSSIAGCRRGSEEDPFALAKPAVPGADQVPPDEEQWLSTSCAQCAAGCGIRARVVGGRLIKLEGHPENPINRGGIGPRGLSGLQVIYDPDRIATPLRRSGPRGSGKWQVISWDDALAELVARLAKLRESGEPHQLGVICGRERGLTLELWERFCRAYGTPNLVEGLSRRLGALVQASSWTQGVAEIPAHDWTHARYVLSIGAGMLEASCQSIYFTRAAAHSGKGRSGVRARFVQVEPTFSRTAAQADEWIGIAPGTHVAFALGIANVLVRDGLHDADFVREHTFGFEPWTEGSRRVPGFRDVLADYTPERVAATCGISSTVLERIAHQMAAERPALAVTDDRATQGTNGIQVALAVHALNALLGAIDRPGGVLVQRRPPQGERPAIAPDEVARTGGAKPRLDGAGTRFPLARSAIEALPESLLAGQPYALDTLLLHYSNPVYSGMGSSRWTAALARVPFVVTFTPFMDETSAAAADLVLPDHTYLERWEDAGAAPSVGYAVFGARQPVVQPVHQTKSSGDVVLELASRLGAPVSAALPWKSVEDLVTVDIGALHALGRGSIVEEDPDEFRKRLLAEGFWAEDGYVHERWSEVLRTPSGKFEFFSRSLWSRLHELAAANGKSIEQVTAELGHDGDPALACMPHGLPMRWQGDAHLYPFALEIYQPGTYAEGSGANLPLLQELVTEQGQRPWHTLIEIGPETAAKLRVRSGDVVEVASLGAVLSAPASVRRGVRPDVVRIARGGGHSEFGRFAKDWGINALALVSPQMDPYTGVPALQSTRVSVRRIEE